VRLGRNVLDPPSSRLSALESFFGHVKGEWHHLERLRDPDQLRAEPEVVRAHDNTSGRAD